MWGWPAVTLADVCEIDNSRHKGVSLPYVGMEDIESGTGRWIGSDEPQNVRSSTFAFTREHVLYGRLRPYLNKVLVPPFEGHCSTEVIPLKTKAGLDKRFLFYWITSQSVVAAIDKTCTGARMPRANMNAVMQLKLPLPELAEQQRIVTFLDEAFAGLDAAIANTEMNRPGFRGGCLV